MLTSNPAVQITIERGCIVESGRKTSLVAIGPGSDQNGAQRVKIEAIAFRDAIAAQQVVSLIVVSLPCFLIPLYPVTN